MGIAHCTTDHTHKDFLPLHGGIRFYISEQSNDSLYPGNQTSRRQKERNMENQVQFPRPKESNTGASSDSEARE